MPKDFSGPGDPVADIPAWRRDLDSDYEESDIYRETFLQWLDGREDLATTVRAYGRLQYHLTLNYPHGSPSREHWRATALRSAAKDLRHLKNYLRGIAFDGDDESDEVDEPWIRYARRLAQRLGAIEEHVERALKTGPVERRR
jgi:hypothetical protein